MRFSWRGCRSSDGRAALLPDRYQEAPVLPDYPTLPRPVDDELLDAVMDLIDNAVGFGLALERQDEAAAGTYNRLMIAAVGTVLRKARTGAGSAY